MIIFEPLGNWGNGNAKTKISKFGNHANNNAVCLIIISTHTILHINKTIKIEPIYVTKSTYIEFDVENNNKDPKYKVVDHVIISKYKNSFTKYYIPNWSQEVFIIKKLKIPYHDICNKRLGEEIAEAFYEK